MKFVKPLAIALGIYVGLVVLFETGIGIAQPESDGTLVITTTDPDGTSHDRVVSSLESDGRLYVAANHWPRAWFTRAAENPDVQVTLDGETGPYRAVPVSGTEHDQVDAEHPLPLPFRILTGFPPRLFLRLDAPAGQG